MLLKQVEPERLPITMVDMEVIVDSCSSIILAVCSKCACVPGGGLSQCYCICAADMRDPRFHGGMAMK